MPTAIGILYIVRACVRAHGHTYIEWCASPCPQYVLTSRYFRDLYGYALPVVAFDVDIFTMLLVWHNPMSPSNRARRWAHTHMYVWKAVRHGPYLKNRVVCLA